MQKKVGLALGSGSVKGLAHIGVLDVLEKSRVPIDMIAGCSMGAIIGSIYSVGTDLRLLERFINTINLHEYLDISNPVSGGLVRGVRLEELLRVFTHDKSFNQTRIPFVCVAVNASRGELVEFESGKLHQRVRASMSIPGIFTPVEMDGGVYIDGGVLDRVPCKALKHRGMDVVIGVDVGYRGGGFDMRHASAYQQLTYTIDIMQWEITRLRTVDADVLIEPEVRALVRSRFSVSAASACIEEGRRAARAALPAILKKLEDNGIALLDAP